MKPRTPTRWATDISVVLNAVLGTERFPISVPDVAVELSRKYYPDDPLSVIKGADLPGMDGALFPAPPGEIGWGIFYNNAVTSKGRINFTLAHEFGHYLVHRLAFPDGIRCSQQAVLGWGADYKLVENEANTFAAHLLMPFADYRRQIDAKAEVTFDMLSQCAERYEVSLVAAALRWLAYTERRAVLVLSRDGYILWSRSSEAAFKSGAFKKTSGSAVPVPERAVAARPDDFADARVGVELPPGVWFREGCREMTIVSENYDFAISLIQLEPSEGRVFTEDDEGPGLEAVDAKFGRRYRA